MLEATWARIELGYFTPNYALSWFNFGSIRRGMGYKNTRIGP